MDCNLLTICVILGAMPLTAALKCFECVYTKQENDPTIRPGASADQACYYGANIVPSVTCSGGTSCVKTKLKITRKDAGSTYSVEETYRGCFKDVLHLGFTGTTNDICETIDPETSRIIASIIDGAETVSGTVCNCISNKCNGQSMAAPAILTFVISLVMVIFVSI